MDDAGNRSPTNTYVYVFTNAGIAPVVAVSPTSMVTNKSFPATLSASVGGGRWSTNGGLSWTVFSSPGTNLLIAGATHLLVFATNGNLVSPTNVVNYDWDNVAPTVSAPADFSTNTAFILRLTVNENHGWWSTNSASGPYRSFSTAGTNLEIPQTVSLWFFGRDPLGNTSTTNTRTYAVQGAMLAEQNRIVSLSPEYAFLSGENLRITLSVVRGTPSYRLEIRELEGQRVKTFSSREIDAGQGTSVWNGVWENGSHKSGIYFLDLMVNGQVADRRKIVIIRGRVGY
ncbi:MAG: hypothetical protein JNM63_06100 [Spirochaetia bacterium]|nr:hypothetical protein [Spirochaetia bacterium]